MARPRQPWQPTRNAASCETRRLLRPVAGLKELRESIDRKKVVARSTAKELRSQHATALATSTTQQAAAQPAARRPASAVLSQSKDVLIPLRSPKDWDPQASESPSFSRSRRLGQLSHRLELCLGLKEAAAKASCEPEKDTCVHVGFMSATFSDRCMFDRRCTPPKLFRPSSQPAARWRAKCGNAAAWARQRHFWPPMDQGSLDNLDARAVNPAHRRLPGSHLTRWAEAETDLVVPMTEAPIFLTPVDVVTGECDVSSLPEEMGVYAVYDTSERLQYIGLSRNIQKSVETHGKAIGIQEVGDLVGSVKCVEMPEGSKEELKSVWEFWLKEHLGNGGEIPVGNLPENAPGADPRWRSRGAQAKPSLNLGGVAGIASQAEALDAVRQAVEENPVVLFMKGTPAMPQCGFSARTSGLLREIGVPFETVNVLDENNNPGVREAVKEFGQWPTIPQLYVSGQLVGGADIVMEMYQKGELEQMLVMANEGAGASGEQPEQNAAGDVPQYATGNVQLIDDPNRPTATELCKALKKNLALVDLKVVDDSAAHEGDAGALEMGLTSESHFSVSIVSPDFATLSRVQRQQKVYEALSGVMPRIHALSLVTQTPEEVNADDDGQ
ncbi:unnamed protein product [Cladocopium goreaui]|uniref:Glutaredoxin domain-containing protein n=1 Tax=Cladocopium goreaui TaxID=2562237 RepID=A0A9P1BPS1_9DINO|nr:unnamed protein product [Cladocopium goreaui]